jgi:PAS domain S-box-containing protein
MGEADALLQRLGAAVLVFDREGRVLIGNQAAQTLFGLDGESIRGRTAADLCRGYRSESNQALAIADCPEQRVLASGQAVDGLLLGIRPLQPRKGEETIWVLASAVPVQTEPRGDLQVTVTLVDITERRRAEQALQREKARAQHYLAIAGSLILALDRGHRISLINQAGCRALGYREHELLGRDWIATCIPQPEREKVSEIFRRLMAGEAMELKYVEDHQVQCRDGGVRWVAWHNTLLHDERGRIIGTLSAGEDVTERRLANQRLQSSLQEKEVLLREIHHRVKNNLQVVSSLLTLESRLHGDPKTGRSLSDTQGRIQAMALVHNKLYQSADLTRVDLGAYVRDLAAGLQQLHSTEARGVGFVIDCEPIALSVDIAVPCGLVLNELLTNALKYAFPGHSQGQIRVGACRQDDAMIRIEVSDDGIGLPPKIDLDRASTLGLSLVRALVAQVGGRIEREQAPGTRFAITLAAPAVAEP